MITGDEIEHNSLGFGIHVANVQRDYVFGWLLVGLYNATTLRDLLILKGGNCFRKAIFPNTRFSVDLDFSTQAAIDESFVVTEFNKACQFVEAQPSPSFSS